MTTVAVKKLSVSASLPTRAHENDAGWDLYSNETATVPSHTHKTLKTGIAMDIPHGYVGIVYGRSGLASRSGIIKLAGVIDAGYHGEIGVVIFNGGKEDVTIKMGDRIAQLIIHSLPVINLVEKDSFESNSVRKEKGFGSTGT